jgi:4-hydroxy-3-methylbut-2-en-1-yl diphosphate reductase
MDGQPTADPLFRPRRILLAAPRSFCAGVERAIQIVLQALRDHGAPVYVRRQIVHNSHVVDQLRQRGAIVVAELDEVPDGAVVVFSAHGVAPSVLAEARRRRLQVVDATCPLVSKVHAEARRFARNGHTVVLVGQAGHDEIVGTMGEAPERTRLVQTVADARTVTVSDPRRVAVLTQTTLAVEETAHVVDALRARFPLLRTAATDDICYAATNRQHAVQAISAECDVVLVLGSPNSHNTECLVRVARRAGVPAWLLEDAAHLQPQWLTGVDTVGITAGASAPPALVEDLAAAIAAFGPVRIEERTVTVETLHFAPTHRSTHGATAASGPGRPGPGP